MMMMRSMTVLGQWCQFCQYDLTAIDQSLIHIMSMVSYANFLYTHIYMYIHYILRYSLPVLCCLTSHSVLFLAVKLLTVADTKEPNCI